VTVLLAAFSSALSGRRHLLFSTLAGSSRVQQERLQGPPHRRASGQVLERRQSQQPGDPVLAANRTSRYEKLTQRDHVLRRPDMYIGPVDRRPEVAWVFTSKTRMMEQELMLSPGLVQIFNEILVNAIDQQFAAGSGQKMTAIRVSIDTKLGEISVWNDGGSIPVALHPATGLYLPSLVFGEFLSGNNFDDSSIRFVGGRNGVGAKATNVFSKSFDVEVEDPGTRLRFHQHWEDNMKVRGEAETSPLPDDSTSGSVMVRFRPDLGRFNLSRIDKDHMKIFQARAFDAAACTRPDINVYFNGQSVGAQNFEDYAKYMLGDEFEVTSIEDDTGRVRAEVAVAFAGNNGFGALGLVNGIRCSRGTHVDKVVDFVAQAVAAMGTGLNVRHVKPLLKVVVKVLVDNPDFDSQSKTRLTTTVAKLGFSLSMSPEFYKRVAKLGILEAAQNSLAAAAKRDLRKSLSAAALPPKSKLEDAENAGKPGAGCTLILTEGDSAKALAVAGLSKLGRKNYGIYPLRGKLLNVRSASPAKLRKNDDIKALVQILGLVWGRKYTSALDTEELRYQYVMIFSDQDLDGHHIAGLIINFIHAWWPSLLKVRPNFFLRFATPIVKVFDKRSNDGPARQVFFTQGDFNVWQQQEPDWSKRYRAKYYKGLGTSTRTEAIEYFSNPAQHVMELLYTGKRDNWAVERAFGKDNIPDRKKWLLTHNPTAELNYSQESASVSEFFEKQFIHFSVYDCIRSIPLLLDGFKPSQRKVLHVLRKQRGEKKVAHLAGLVSAQTNYHHGEDSLVQVIVHMAQRFVGTNNINLLEPNGMFGSRLTGRSSHASARYIHTLPNPLTPLIFRKDDDAILPQIMDEGEEVEPQTFLPVVPMVLINPFKGIGTGWACAGLAHNPVDVVEALESLIRGEEPAQLVPHYNGFLGTLTIEDDGRILSEGRWRVFSSEGQDGPIDSVEVTELPPGTWTEDFISDLEEKAKRTSIMMELHKCDDHNDEKIHLIVAFERRELALLMNGKDNVTSAIGDLLNLRKRLPMSMWLYHTDEPYGHAKLTFFNDANEVLRAFYNVRLKYYELRREYLEKKLQHEADLRGAQGRFVRSCIEGSLRMQNLTEELLELKGFRPLRSLSDEEDDNANFNYLLNMKFRSVTPSGAEDLENKATEAAANLERLQALSVRDMWLNDLQMFREAYEKAQKSLNSGGTSKGHVDTSEVEAEAARQFQEARRKKMGTVDALDSDLTPTKLATASKAELAAFCRFRDLPSDGSKEELKHRLLVHVSNKFKAKDIRGHLTARGQPDWGNKTELLDRLQLLGRQPTKAQMLAELRENGLSARGSREEVASTLEAFRSRRSQEAEKLENKLLPELKEMAIALKLQSSKTKNQFIYDIATRLAAMQLDDVPVKQAGKSVMEKRLVKWLSATRTTQKKFGISGLEAQEAFFAKGEFYESLLKVYEKSLK